MVHIMLYFPTCLEHSDQGIIQLDPYCPYKDGIPISINSFKYFCKSFIRDNMVWPILLSKVTFIFIENNFYRKYARFLVFKSSYKNCLRDNMVWPKLYFLNFYQFFIKGSYLRFISKILKNFWFNADMIWRRTSF